MFRSEAEFHLACSVDPGITTAQRNISHDEYEFDVELTTLGKLEKRSWAGKINLATTVLADHADRQELLARRT